VRVAGDVCASYPRETQEMVTWIVLAEILLSIGVQKGPPIGVQKGPPSSSSVTGMTGAPFALVAA
jgi:hypothetical protein